MGEQFPGDKNIRVSDTERSAALAALGQFYAEGRLSLEETDDRCEAVADAKTRGDLNAIFYDLPNQQIAVVDRSEQTYTATEVAELHRKGARPRAGILGLTTVLAITGTAAFASTTTFATVLLALIPIVFIMLYVMKIGPESWHAPTPRQLQRKRMIELREKEKLRDMELKAQRKERTHALTNRALDAAETAFNTKPWKKNK